MKQHSRYCITFLRRGNHQSSLNHLEFNIHNIIIMFWVEEFQEMVHFIIINWFYFIGNCIWNRFMVIFNCKILIVNLNITVINGMVIKSPHDSWNQSTGFGRRGPGFGMICWRLDVPIYWWTIWFLTMKVFELIHPSSNNLWVEFRATDDAGIILVTNPSK